MTSQEFRELERLRVAVERTATALEQILAELKRIACDNGPGHGHG